MAVGNSLHVDFCNSENDKISQKTAYEEGFFVCLIVLAAVMSLFTYFFH